MRHENSLQTAARWTGYGIVGFGLFNLFTFVVGSIVWMVMCLRVRKYPRKYRKMLKQHSFYTDFGMGLGYVCFAFTGLLALLFFGVLWSTIYVASNNL